MTDGIIIGERAYKKLIDAWLSAACDVFAMDGDKDALKEFRVAFGRNPAHIKKAVERFPDVWNADTHGDLFDLLGTIQLSKVKDDETAKQLFAKWNDDVSLEYDDLKQLIASANGKPAKRATKQCEACEQVKTFIELEMGMIEADPRYHYKPAVISINAPLALEQQAMSARMSVLKQLQAALKRKGEAKA